jgi:membrane-bound lytic murein transglycosylase A
VRDRASRVAIVVVALVLSGCAPWWRHEPLTPISERKVPPLVDDLDVDSLRLALERTVPVYERTGRAGTIASARRLLDVLAATTDPVERRRLLATSFRMVRVRDPLLVTSYYEPELAVSERPDRRYRFPIYRRPPDLQQPYYSRAEIDAGVLAGRKLELAWTDDAFALFSLHVQGCGRARFPDGRTAGIRFAGTNGLEYRSLGRLLIERGLLRKGEASMFAIRDLFATMPYAEQRALMAENPRYVFFAMTDGKRGPVGSLGVELTPMRSVATDPELVPGGTIAYVVTPTIRRFVVAQDTGGAIRGAHADIFAGAGWAAEQFAGRQQERGTMYVLVPL